MGVHMTAEMYLRVINFNCLLSYIDDKLQTQMHTINNVLNMKRVERKQLNPQNVFYRDNTSFIYF